MKTCIPAIISLGPLVVWASSNYTSTVQDCKIIDLYGDSKNPAILCKSCQAVYMKHGYWLPCIMPLNKCVVNDNHRMVGRKKYLCPVHSNCRDKANRFSFQLWSAGVLANRAPTSPWMVRSFPPNVVVLGLFGLTWVGISFFLIYPKYSFTSDFYRYHYREQRNGKLECFDSTYCPNGGPEC